jgi:diguanylate cyclase (GGDEF)-like protein
VNGRPTIGVLSTSFGGTYFGSVLGGIKRATAAADGRIIAIQTLDAGTVDRDLSDPPEFHHRVSWDHVSGFVVILNAVNKDYLAAIRNTGKPVVMISDNLPGFSCPVVLPDNRIGIHQAVDHLVEHGHHAIAFAGHPVQRDFRQRYEAYRDALTRHGITPRSDLFFDTGNNQESGGEDAAGKMIAAGLPSTAVIAGNDLNAVGLMRALTAAGYELPWDQAVVGFDDMDWVVYLTPSLSSVRQRFDDVGSRAVELVLQQLAGDEVEPGFHYVPTTFVPRESCGCADTLALCEPADAPSSVTTTEELAARLMTIVGRVDVDSSITDIVDRATEEITNNIRAAADGAPGLNPFRLRLALSRLHGLQPGPENLIEMMRSVRSFGRHAASTARADDGDAAERVDACTEEIMVALAQSQARAQFRDGRNFQSTLNTQYTVSMNLLRSHEEDPRMLAWIEGTHSRAGCLGLWSKHSPELPTGEAALDIVTVFERGRQPVQTDGTATTPCSFPPAEVVALADLAVDDMVFVAPMKVNSSDWGMLAIVGPIEAAVPTGREMMNQWAALLTIALDHEAVLESLREREERLRYAALYDQLTGLANRTLFLERLQHSIARAQRRTDYRFAVLLLDLDGFKLVNDSLGHLAGDQLLVQVAARVGDCIRATDIAARFGGDEFAILLDDIVDVDSPVAVAERIHAALKTPFRLGDEEVVVSSSIGISLSTTGYDHAEDVIRDADTAMYSAKWRGKGTHAIFDVGMHARAVGRLRTEAELRRALDMGELEAHFQPIVRLQAGQVAAVEALMRWRHPIRGLISPADFLPIAEESGLMLPMGRWILAESCRQLRAWQISGAAPDGLKISVNVSDRQFWHGRLLEDVRDCIELANIQPRDLCLEITEGVIMRDAKLARMMLTELHEMGVELHIDDFGTGYSSLEALCHLPIDGLKIDRSFVSPLGSDSRSSELVRTIVLMGANLGMEIIAEGVETAEQWDYLRRIDCTYGQGYLFSRPLPGDEMTAFLAASSPVALRTDPHGSKYVAESKSA